jgi:lipopolysaccharide transport system ATP-binding protein
MGTITVTNLGKAYKQYPTRWARLGEWVLPGAKPRHTLKWVLQDINFTVKAGEAVGIIGINGAGKSTLLKMITGTTQPTTGHVVISGRVAAMLELGMGFHPDFTGRQNVFMAGQLLGYSVDEIACLMPEIEAFAEIGEYIDQPVRVYSSGMQMRLAFSVATAQRPNVLIVDEALSVGDAAFQRKCFHRIESYRCAGTTLLFVSHDIEIVKKLCDSAMFIMDGQMAHFGQAKIVCDKYEKFIFGGSHEYAEDQGENNTSRCEELGKFDPSLIASCEMRYGNGKAEIESCRITDLNGQQINIVESGTSFCWCYRVRFNEAVQKPIFAMMLKTVEGITLYGVDSALLKLKAKYYAAGETVEVQFSLTNLLAQGVYYLNCGVRIKTINGDEFLSRRVDSAILRITAGPSSTVATGLVEMGAKLNIKTA